MAAATRRDQSTAVRAALHISSVDTEHDIISLAMTVRMVSLVRLIPTA
jgi:hypothetical protein